MNSGSICTGKNNIKTRFKVAYNRCINTTDNPITLLAKVTILTGIVGVEYTRALVKRVITEKDSLIAEKLYGTFADKLIKCLHLEMNDIRISLKTQIKDSDELIMDVNNLHYHHVEGVDYSKKTICIWKTYEYKINKTNLTFRISVLIDMCKTFYDHYIQERCGFGMPVHLPNLSKIIFTVSFILVNLPRILFI